jgi:hypothetical protein
VCFFKQCASVREMRKLSPAAPYGCVPFRLCSARSLLRTREVSTSYVKLMDRCSDGVIEASLVETSAKRRTGSDRRTGGRISTPGPYLARGCVRAAGRVVSTRPAGCPTRGCHQLKAATLTSPHCRHCRLVAYLPSKLLASPSELIAPPSEISRSPSELLASAWKLTEAGSLLPCRWKSFCAGARLLSSARSYGGPAHHTAATRTPYTTELCGCCDDKGGNQCCYVFWCYPCAAGHAVAMLQVRGSSHPSRTPIAHHKRPLCCSSPHSASPTGGVRVSGPSNTPCWVCRGQLPQRLAIPRRESCESDTGRQKMPLERGTKPKRSRRTCSPRYGLQSYRRGWEGVAKRPRERSPTRIPIRPSQLSHPLYTGAPVRRDGLRELVLAIRAAQVGSGEIRLARREGRLPRRVLRTAVRVLHGVPGL